MRRGFVLWFLAAVSFFVSALVWFLAGNYALGALSLALMVVMLVLANRSGGSRRQRG